MVRIIDGRGTGKTAKLLILAQENDAILVCSNPRAMEYKAKQYGIDGVECISYGQFHMECQWNKEQKFIIDELESFLMAQYGDKILGYSISLE